MARALLLYRMEPGAPLDGTVLAEGVLCCSEIVQRIKEVTDENVEFPILAHPVMRPDKGIVDLVSLSRFSSSSGLSDLLLNLKCWDL